MTTKPLVERSITYESDGQPFLKVTDCGDGVHVKINCYYKGTGKDAYWFQMSLKTFLDLFVALWPDEIAYQFKSDEDG